MGWHPKITCNKAIVRERTSASVGGNDLCGACLAAGKGPGSAHVHLRDVGAFLCTTDAKLSKCGWKAQGGCGWVLEVAF